MDTQALKQWLEFASAAVAIIAAVVTAIWAYIKFVVERGLLPPVEFSVDCTTVGVQADKGVVEILLYLKNLGTSTLVATNLRVDVRYLTSTEAPKLFLDPADEKYGRLAFPGSLKRDLEESRANAGNKTEDRRPPETIGRDEKTKKEKKGIGVPVLLYDTFVQPGVKQTYTFATAVPASTSFLRVLGSFEYEMRPSRFQRFILSIGRPLGLVQFSLKHVTEPHTAERVFKFASP